jgi:hypothetical protein
MAIFASTTLGSSDPSKAMSIKALEARAQALAAAQAKQEQPTSLPSPWQGASLVMNQAADAFATKRADQAAAQRRQDLAGYMSAAGDNPTMQQIGQITAADQEVGKTYMQEISSRRAAAAQIQAAKELAAQKAQQDEAYAVSQEQRVQGRPQTDQGKVKADLAAGKLSPEEADAAMKKLNAGSPAEQKAVNEQQDANIELQSQVAGLREAQGLLNAGKVYSGGGAEFKETAGKYAPSALGGVLGVDAESTKATQRYNQIVSPQVLDVLSKLKGASSDRDMMFAINTLNDKSADIETKKKALATLLPKVEAHLKASEGRLTKMGGERIAVETPATGGGEVPVAGPQSVASEADALKLPPGTKFKLPDGRTGTAR